MNVGFLCILLKRGSFTLQLCSGSRPNSHRPNCNFSVIRLHIRNYYCHRIIAQLLNVCVKWTEV